MKKYNQGNKIKIISLFMILIILLTNIIPISSFIIYAENTTKNSLGSINQEDDGINVGIDEKQEQKTTYSDEIIEDSKPDTFVYVSQSSSFGVTIPKTIIMEGQKNENGLNVAHYEINVSKNSNIGGLETIKVVPDETFKMNTYGKNPIIVNISQDKIDWRHDELEEKGNGLIYTDKMTAGSWNGTFNFNIKLNDSFIEVIAKNSNNVDLKASSSLIVGEEKEKLMDSLLKSGLIKNESDVNALIDVKSSDFDSFATTTFDVSNIAKSGDKITILHFDETKGEWEYITTQVVNNEGKITANFTSFSPVAFVKENDDGSLTQIKLQAGMYTMDNVLIKSWNQLITEGTIKVNSSGVLTTSNATTKIYDKLVVDDTVKTINEYAFRDCTKLKEIILSEKTATLGSQAFKGCTALKKVSIPINTVFGSNCFTNTPNINEIVILKGTGVGATLSDNSDYGGSCRITPWYGKTISKIEIPEGVTSIGNYYFYNAKVSKVILPNSLTSIGSYSFANTSITSIGPKGSGMNFEIPNNLKNIGEHAFYNCDKLTKVIYPSHLTKIVYGMFRDCDGLTSIGYNNTDTFIIHSSVYQIGNAAFEQSNNLKYVNVSKNMKTIGDYAFRDCTGLQEIILSENTTTLASQAFNGCTTLKKVTVPINTVFGSNCFTNTPKINEIVILKGTGVGATLSDNSDYGGSCQITPWYGKTISKIEIPKGVTSIGSYYFYNAKIGELVVPNTVKTIGKNAFYKTQHLTYTGSASGAPWRATSMN